jgi:hypothetical protein
VNIPTQKVIATKANASPSPTAAHHQQHPHQDSIYTREINSLKNTIAQLREQIAHLALELTKRVPSGNDATEKTDLPNVQSDKNLEVDYLNCQVHDFNDETNNGSQADMCSTSLAKQKHRVPKSRSTYSSAIAELRVKESKMDCSTSTNSENTPRTSTYSSAIVELRSKDSQMDCTNSVNCENVTTTADTKSSAYARAAKILATSSELVGEDRNTVLSLLMDFDRSLDYQTDDDAMSSLYD